MFDAEYCARMKPLIKLQLIFVGGFLLLPLLLAAAIYVSSAFGYCYSYSMAPTAIAPSALQSELVIDDGVTAVITHGYGAEQAGFKVKSVLDEALFTITTDRPLFPCSRFEGELDLTNLSFVTVKSAAILSLRVSGLAYDVLKLDTSQTISQLEFANCAAREVVFTGTGELFYAGTAQSISVTAASVLKLDVDMRGGTLEAQLTGGFAGILSNFSKAAITTVSTGAEQSLCVALDDIYGRCVRTLNKYWSGDSGASYYEDGERVGYYTRAGIQEHAAFVGRREKDVYIICFGQGATDIAVDLDNRGDALVLVYKGEPPKACEFH